jgi:hypothetical protein
LPPTPKVLAALTRSMHGPLVTAAGEARGHPAYRDPGRLL